MRTLSHFRELSVGGQMQWVDDYAGGVAEVRVTSFAPERFEELSERLQVLAEHSREELAPYGPQLYRATNGLTHFILHMETLDARWGDRARAFLEKLVALPVAPREEEARAEVVSLLAHLLLEKAWTSDDALRLIYRGSELLAGLMKLTPPILGVYPALGWLDEVTEHMHQRLPAALLPQVDVLAAGLFTKMDHALRGIPRKSASSEVLESYRLSAKSLRILIWHGETEDLPRTHQLLQGLVPVLESVQAQDVLLQ